MSASERADFPHICQRSAVTSTSEMRCICPASLHTRIYPHPIKSIPRSVSVLSTCHSATSISGVDLRHFKLARRATPSSRRRAPNNRSAPVRTDNSTRLYCADVQSLMHYIPLFQQSHHRHNRSSEIVMIISGLTGFALLATCFLQILFLSLTSAQGTTPSGSGFTSPPVYPARTSLE
jgi:hypothetical protein